MTPTSTLPSATLATDTQKCGTPRAKFAVPSIGSTTHDRPALARRAALALFADKPVGRKNLQQALGDERLRLAVDLGQIVLAGLEADCERPVEETAPRHRAGLARDRLRREQPHIHERLGAFGHPCLRQKWLYAPRSKWTGSPSAPMKLGGRRPATASPTNVKGTPAARAAASKAGADSRGAEARSS